MQNNKLLIIIGVVAFVLIIGVLIVLFGIPDPKKETITLTMWGIYDDASIFSKLKADFALQFPNTKIDYKKVSDLDYEKQLLDAMAAGSAPDIIMMNNTRLPIFKNKLKSAPTQVAKDSSLPQDSFTLRNYQQGFVDVAVSDFVDEGKIWAVPLYVDTLALYYNKDILATYGYAVPPANWTEFMEYVENIAEVNEANDIVKSAAAIGAAENINRSTDILSLLMLQNGTSMVNADKDKAAFNSKSGEDALRFYTSFADPAKSVYTWNSTLDYSIDMFVEQRTAMMLNYSYNLSTIKAKAPWLNFDIAPMPQKADAATDINYANYLGLAVSEQCSKRSTSKTDACYRAWEFLMWFSQPKNHQKYLELSKRPTARKDLVSWQKNDLDLGVFAPQSASAKSWYQADSVAVEDIFKNMIESVLTGTLPINEAINKAAAQVTVLMK